MADHSAAHPSAVNSERLCGMAAAVGVILSADRAATLVPQAEQHFTQLRLLDAVANSRSEPAAELHLDRWTRSFSE